MTAPFRALARLFGGDADSETLGAIEFDPGMDGLRPPEKQKLRTVAAALEKRPQLSLTIKPAYSPAADRSALQSVAARSAVLARAGIKLEPGESPGPLDYGNARIQQAIEAVFVDQFGLPAARDLRASLPKPFPPPPTEGAKPVASALPAIRLARAMSDRLIEGASVSDADLAALAKRRGSAIADELKAAGKIEPSRVTTTAPQAVDAASGPIISNLDLAVAK